MESEWDPAKARADFTKHGVRFVDAVTALEDDSALTICDLSSEDEERRVTMGRDVSGRLLVVVYRWRGERVRLISARQTTPDERWQYGEST